MRLRPSAPAALVAAAVVLAAAVAAAVCFAAPGRAARAQGSARRAADKAARDSARREVKEAGVSFVYSADDFGRVTARASGRRTAREAGDEVATDISPPRRCFDLEDRRPLPALEQGPRYFHPARSTVCLIPLADPPAGDFAESYPQVSQAASRLRSILRRRPRRFGRLARWGTWEGVPDLPDNNAGTSMIVKPAYLDAAKLSGILFLTQYSQELRPNPANNEELTYNFQGLTRDGRHYVAARFAVTHPSLPKGIDFANVERDGRLLYLRRDERKLGRLPEDSFRPSLRSLRALLSSIEVR